jgi:cysteine desulfurase
LALIAVQHETGVVQPVGAAVATGAGWVHVDAVQAIGRVPLEFDGVASVTLSAHKLGGPVGVGVLSLAPGRSVRAVIPGAQERGMRGGTTPVALAVGMAEAVRLASRGWEAEAARQAALRDALARGLAGLGARVVGVGAAPSVAAVVFPGLLGEDVVIGLDLEGVAVSAGAACASGSQGPSPALVAMGDPAPRGLVRFSLGPGTSAAEVEAALAATARVVERLRT